MHAYLLIGRNKKSLDAEITRLLKKLSAKAFDFDLQKIADARELSTFTKLRQSEKIAIVIKDIDTATTEALNAFLKNLEEPQENIIYILTSLTEHNILPTILSRCQLVRVKDEKVMNHQEARKFSRMTTSEKLRKIDTIRKKYDATAFLQELINYHHHLLVAGRVDAQQNAKYLAQTQKALNAINANGNITLQLTNFVLTTD